MNIFLFLIEFSFEVNSYESTSRVYESTSRVYSLRV